MLYIVVYYLLFIIYDICHKCCLYVIAGIGHCIRKHISQFTDQTVPKLSYFKLAKKAFPPWLDVKGTMHPISQKERSELYERLIYDGTLCNLPAKTFQDPHFVNFLFTAFDFLKKKYVIYVVYVVFN